MSLDWFRLLPAQRVHIHWGAGLLLVQWGKEPMQELPCQLTWGREQVLAEVAQALQSHRTLRNTKRQLRLHITLGASLCAVGSHALPQGIRHWEEVLALAQARLVQLWPGQVLHCAVDPVHPQVTVGVAKDLVEALYQWAGMQGAIVASVQPLWSVATECPRVHKKHILALAVQERDALTLIHQNGALTAVEMQSLPLAQQDGDDVRVTLRRWRMAHGLDEKAVLHLKFGNAPRQTIVDGPVHWAGYWSVQ